MSRYYSTRSRSLLHEKHLPDFRRWLQERGWTIEPNIGDFEVLRARHPKVKHPIIFHQRFDTEHVTAIDFGLKLAGQFVRERKHAERRDRDRLPADGDEAGTTE